MMLDLVMLCVRDACSRHRSNPRDVRSRGFLSRFRDLGHLGAAAAAKAALQRDADALVAVALAGLVENEGGLRAVGPEQQPVAVAAAGEEIVDVEGHRGVRPWPIFDERGPIRAAVEVRVELIGAIEGESLVVGDREAVGPFPAVAANVEAPLPRREEAAPFAEPASDRVFDAGPLECAAELEAQALPQARSSGASSVRRAKSRLPAPRLPGASKNFSTAGRKSGCGPGAG